MTAHKLDKRAFFFKKDLWFQRILKKAHVHPPQKNWLTTTVKKE